MREHDENSNRPKPGLSPLEPRRYRAFPGNNPLSPPEVQLKPKAERTGLIEDQVTTTSVASGSNKKESDKEFGPSNTSIGSPKSEYWVDPLMSRKHSRVSVAQSCVSFEAKAKTMHDVSEVENNEEREFEPLVGNKNTNSNFNTSTAFSCEFEEQDINQLHKHHLLIENRQLKEGIKLMEEQLLERQQLITRLNEQL
mmetsp:Transcript_9405/g.10902  ORF Transcript_9405/g.10902 Transcript_9405/m.10902 type:complete len:197 (-) Transcript_9405:1523-2113(-)